MNKLEGILEYSSSLADLRMARGCKMWSSKYSGIPPEVWFLLDLEDTAYIKLTIQRLIALVAEAKGYKSTEI